jgi:hypothetical protein
LEWGWSASTARGTSRGGGASQKKSRGGGVCKNKENMSRDQNVSIFNIFSFNIFFKKYFNIQHFVDEHFLKMFQHFLIKANQLFFLLLGQRAL